MNIDLYYTSKSKTLKLWSSAKTECRRDKQKLKQVQEQEDWVDQTTREFENEFDLHNLKEKAKNNKEDIINFNDADQLEKVLGEFREAALVINRENRMKQGGSSEKKTFKSTRELSK